MSSNALKSPAPGSGSKFDELWDSRLGVDWAAQDRKFKDQLLGTFPVTEDDTTFTFKHVKDAIDKLQIKVSDYTYTTTIVGDDKQLYTVDQKMLALVSQQRFDAEILKTLIGNPSADLGDYMFNRHDDAKKVVDPMACDACQGCGTIDFEDCWHCFGEGVDPTK